MSESQTPYLPRQSEAPAAVPTPLELAQLKKTRLSVGLARTHDL